MFVVLWKVVSVLSLSLGLVSVVWSVPLEYRCLCLIVDVCDCTIVDASCGVGAYTYSIRIAGHLLQIKSGSMA